VASGSAGGAGWELFAEPGTPVCAELRLKGGAKGSGPRLCAKAAGQDSNGNDTLRFAWATVTQGSLAAPIVLGIAQPKVASVRVALLSKESYSGKTKAAPGITDHRFVAIPLPAGPGWYPRSVFAVDKAGKDLVSFPITRIAVASGPTQGGVAGPSAVPTAPQPAASTSPATASPAPASPKPGSASPAPSSAASSTTGTAAAPWAGEKVAKISAPTVLIQQWQMADNHQSCAAVLPDSFGEVKGGKPRRANFAGGWAIAYDRPGLPGRLASGNPCSSCGRGVFGVAGTGAPAEGPEAAGTLDQGSVERLYSDGSRAVYHLEGGNGPDYLASLYIKGQGCLYNIWSFAGKDHLEYLLDHLRFVEGAP
jgi:hypothetical protein